MNGADQNQRPNPGGTGPAGQRHDDLLSRILSSEIIATNVEKHRFSRRFITADQVIATNRFILVRAGAMCYRIENRETRFLQGSLMLIPAWVRRVWRSDPFCELIWCEFSSPPLEVLRPVPLFSRICDVALENAAFERLLTAWHQGPERDRLLMEGELKAMLARFLGKAMPHDGHASAAAAPGTKNEPGAALRHALDWAEKHYVSADAFEVMRTQCGFSPNHFRTVFRRQTGFTVGEYLLRLRMRQARFLLHESEKAVKEIAHSVGYPDALYFSRCYRRFWGNAPTSDRTRVTGVDDPRRTIETRSRNHGYQPQGTATSAGNGVPLLKTGKRGAGPGGRSK